MDHKQAVYIMAPLPIFMVGYNGTHVVLCSSFTCAREIM